MSTQQEQPAKDAAPLSAESNPPFAASPSALAFTSRPPVAASSASPSSRPTIQWLPEEPWNAAESGESSYLVRCGRAVAAAALAMLAPLGKRFVPAPPIHFSEAQLRRAEAFAREAGWHGPVLWYIPENVTLNDLVKVGVVSARWWSREPNFPRCMPTVSPYDDAGSWVLGAPLPHPSTLGRALHEQVAMLPSLAHVLGFRKSDMVLGDATDLALIAGVARTMHALDPAPPVAVRTETCLHLSECSRSWFEHLDMINVSLVIGNEATELGDYPNTARAPFLGITPLVY